MFIAFIIIGVVSFVLGIIFLVAPDFMIDLNEKTRRVVTTDSYAIKNHRLVGVVFLIVALVLLYFRFQM